MFSTNIEKELLENKSDIAVHALKDLPSAPCLRSLNFKFLLISISFGEFLFKKQFVINPLVSIEGMSLRA